MVEYADALATCQPPCSPPLIDTAPNLAAATNHGLASARAGGAGCGVCRRPAKCA